MHDAAREGAALAVAGHRDRHGRAGDGRVARAWAKNDYGAPTTTSGPNGSWDTPLNVTSNYADEARSVASKGVKWLGSNKKVANRAIVLDVDDTTLTTWSY